MRRVYQVRKTGSGPKNSGEGTKDMATTTPMKALSGVEDSIFFIRGERVMVDADLARLYGVTTKRLNEQVKRNRLRFPADFMFQLNRSEKAELVANCDRLKNLKHSTSLPHVFTEHGAIMLASVLNSQRAVEMSIFVVRAFVRMREVLTSHKVIVQKLDQMERKFTGHDQQIRALFDAIRELMKPPVHSRKSIGFKSK